MRPIEKVRMIDKISLYLDKHFSYSQIDIYLMDFGIDYRQYEEYLNEQNKKDYAEELLKFQNSETILQIAIDLDIDNTTKNMELATFWEQGYFKLFISHLAIYKKNASALQSILLNYGISGFVAHEDIEPSKEWQEEIEKALHSMDALTAILMNGFKESNWCDQEVGFAVGKDVLIIPIRKEIDPYGFIGKYQAIKGSDTTVQEVAKLIFETIIKHPKTRNDMLIIFINLIANSTHVGTVLKQLKILSTIQDIPIEILEQMSEQIKNNNVLINSKIFMQELRLILDKYNINILDETTNNTIKITADIPF